MLGALQPWDPPRLRPYRLLGRLGAGGFGRVFLGQSADGRLAAVKMILAGNEAKAEYLTRFRREAAAARKVRGRFTVQVIGGCGRTGAMAGHRLRRRAITC